MKRFLVIFCMLIMMGCSVFDNIKEEDINEVEARLQQLVLVLGTNKDIDAAQKLLTQAKKALELKDKIQAEEYEAAALIIIEELEGK